jgi:peroxiredoxin
LKRNDVIIMIAGLLVGAGLAVFVYFVLDLGSGNSRETDEIPGVSIPKSPTVGSQALDFELTSLNGDTIRLHDLRGKIVIINFWATWCEPCKVEMPLFEKLFQSEPSNLEILGVNFDEPPQQVEKFVANYQLNFPILLDPGGEVQALYRVIGYPTTFVVDEQGIVQFHHIGLMTEDQLNNYIAQLGENE